MANEQTTTIKDYLHFYFGNECEISDLPKRMILEGWEEGRTKIGGYLLDCCQDCTIKPILRPLSSMTEEEFYECKTMVAKLQNQPGFVNKVLIGEQFTNITPQKIYKEDFHVTAWLLSRGFDLFALIESGLAIEKQQNV